MRRFGRPPAKGTKSRQFLLLSLRPQGVSHAEACSIVGKPEAISGLLAQLRNEKGYDIRSFPEPRNGRRGRYAYTHRCVGKMRWDGSYRSFIHDSLSEAA